jgi:hypothetical protein
MHDYDYVNTPTHRDATGMIHSDMARQLPVSDSLRQWREAKAQAEGGP